jgi:HEAT repeat protein
MTEPRPHRSIVRNRNKSPLSKLRTSDVIKTVVDHPRRLEELLLMLEDKDRSIRGKAAAIIAQLAESHPNRLLRAIARLNEAFSDDSAYVRWHLAFALGELGSHYPAKAELLINEIAAKIDDENRIVRVISGKALAKIAERKPAMIETLFKNLKKEAPDSIMRALRSANKQSQPQ